MKQTPSSQLVSVVIPCYNLARFLNQAIESVLAQTRPASQIGCEGIRGWRQEYGEQLIYNTRRQLRCNEWRQALSALLWLLEYHPRGFFRHAWRKASRVALGHKPETYDAIGR